jgi:hypothetical protein
MHQDQALLQLLQPQQQPRQQQQQSQQQKQQQPKQQQQFQSQQRPPKELQQPRQQRQLQPQQRPYVLPLCGEYICIKTLDKNKKNGKYLKDLLSLLFTQLFSDFFRFEALSVEVKFE